MSVSAVAENRIGRLLLGGSLGLIGINLVLLPVVLFLGVVGDVPGGDVPGGDVLAGRAKQDLLDGPELASFLPPPPPPEMRGELRWPGPGASSLDRSISMLYAGAGDLMADLPGGDLP